MPYKIIMLCLTMIRQSRAATASPSPRFSAALNATEAALMELAVFF